MNIDNKRLDVSFDLGTLLVEAVQKSIEFCKEYKTEVELTYNEKKCTITTLSDPNYIVKNWYSL